MGGSTGNCELSCPILHLWCMTKISVMEPAKTVPGSHKLLYGPSCFAKTQGWSCSPILDKLPSMCNCDCPQEYTKTTRAYRRGVSFSWFRCHGTQVGESTLVKDEDKRPEKEGDLQEPAALAWEVRCEKGDIDLAGWLGVQALLG